MSVQGLVCSCASEAAEKPFHAIFSVIVVHTEERCTEEERNKRRWVVSVSAQMKDIYLSLYVQPLAEEMLF